MLGGGTGTLKGGRHLRFPAETPLANLHVTLLDKLGVPIDTDRRQQRQGGPRYAVRRVGGFAAAFGGRTFDVVEIEGPGIVEYDSRQKSDRSRQHAVRAPLRLEHLPVDVHFHPPIERHLQLVGPEVLFTRSSAMCSPADTRRSSAMNSTGGMSSIKHDVELAIVEHRIRRNQTAAANQPRVAHREGLEGRPAGRRSGAVVRDDRLVPHQHLRAADQVCELAGDRLQLRRDGVGHFRDEAAGRDIHEVLIVEAPEIDLPRLGPAEGVDRLVEVVRDAERGGEVVAGASGTTPRVTPASADGSAATPLTASFSVPSPPATKM